MAFVEIIEGCGLTIPHLVLIGTFFFALIFAAVELRLAIIMCVILYMGEFILFYQFDPGDTLSWGPAMTAFLISIVLLVLSAYRSYAYKTRGII